VLGALNGFLFSRRNSNTRRYTLRITRRRPGFHFSIALFHARNCPSGQFLRGAPVPRGEISGVRNAYYQVRRIVMSARSTFLHFATQAGILFGALFLVSVLLAAIPGHHAPAAPVQEDQQSSSAQSQESQEMDQSKMSGMDMTMQSNEAHAVHDMTPGTWTRTACTCS